MFYTLDKIFSFKPRHAEVTDTRQAIRRQEKDRQRQGDDDQQKEQELFLSEDNTVVSIDALCAFLETFLKSLPEEENEKTPREQGENLAKSALKVGHDFNKKRPVPGDVKQAMGAYESAAFSGREQKTLQSEDAKIAAENLGLQAHEVRIIHKLIEDLKFLSKQNVSELIIERGPSFLESLVAAVEKAKH